MKRRILTVILALVMALSVMPAAFAAAPSMEGQIVILHTNDVHGRASEYMGYTAVAALKTAYEKAGAEVLVFDAGDTLHGKPIATATKGYSIVRIMNEVGYDLMVPGNHDFNYGYRRLAQLANDAMDFPVLAANVTYASNGRLVFDQNKVFNVNGVKIGVFGLATPETLTKSSPLNTKGLVFNDVIETAKAQVYRLEQKGCDIIVALGHIGIDASTKITSEDICKAVDGIDVFIDGHSHSTLEKGMKVNGTLIAQTGTELKAVGAVVINGSKITSQLVTAEQFTGEDAAVSKLVNQYNAIIDEAYDTAVGSTSVKLDGNRAPGVRTMETNLGDLSADALLWAAKSAMGDVDFAVTNGGGIRTTIEAGTITKKKLVEVFPFGNQVCTLQIPGSVVIEILEANCKDCPNASGGFPQVAGITFTIDTTKAYVAGGNNRISNIKIGGVDLDPNKMYTIATNDFLAIGGDAYAPLAAFENMNTGINLEDALINYIATVLGGTVGSEYSAAQGRITIID